MFHFIMISQFHTKKHVKKKNGTGTTTSTGCCPDFGPLVTLCSQRVEKVKQIYSMWSDGSRM